MSTIAISGPALMTKADVASELQISTRQLDYWIRDKKVPIPIRIGSHARWDRQQILDWIAAGCQPVPAKSTAVNRLRHSRQLKADSDRQEGRECCQQWAADSEDSVLLAIQFKSLRKAKKLFDEFGSDCIADLVATHALEYDGTANFRGKDDFWTEIAGMSIDEISEAFAEGFLCEAMQIAEEADNSAE